MINALTSLLFVAALVALVVWSRPRQPHWVSRDGARFIAQACLVDTGGGRPGRWTRVHGRIVEDRVRLRQSFLSAGVLSGSYLGVEREESMDPRFAIFTVGTGERAHLRLPARSPVVASLDSLITPG